MAKKEIRRGRVPCDRRDWHQQALLGGCYQERGGDRDPVAPRPPDRGGPEARCEDRQREDRRLPRPGASLLSATRAERTLSPRGSAVPGSRSSQRDSGGRERELERGHALPELGDAARARRARTSERAGGGPRPGRPGWPWRRGARLGPCPAEPLAIVGGLVHALDVGRSDTGEEAPRERCPREHRQLARSYQVRRRVVVDRDRSRAMALPGAQPGSIRGSSRQRARSPWRAACRPASSIRAAGPVGGAERAEAPASRCASVPRGSGRPGTVRIVAMQAVDVDRLAARGSGGSPRDPA